MGKNDWELRRVANTWQARYALIERVLKGLGYRVTAMDHLTLKKARSMAGWSTDRIIEELVVDDA